MTCKSLCLAPALVAAALLGACADERDAAGSQAAITATQQYPLTARPRADEVRLAPHPSGLSDAQGRALAALAERWLDNGDAKVVVQLPLRGADARATGATADAAQALLASMGVPANRMERASYEPAAGAPATIIVGFASYEAAIPRCGQEWDRVSASPSNRPMQNFGCAVSANMAAQIANPQDIVQAHASDPADQGRRAVVLGKYRQGQPTSTTPDNQASGALGKLGAGG